jgi:hypothetical protein
MPFEIKELEILMRVADDRGRAPEHRDAEPPAAQSGDRERLVEAGVRRVIRALRDLEER